MGAALGAAISFSVDSCAMVVVVTEWRATDTVRGALFYVRPAGRTFSGVQVPDRPDKGNC